MRFMSQGICGATLILAAGGAAAQSSVTLYGVADTFVQYLDNGGKHSFSERSGGSTGSLFGLKGTEDLGNGLKAEFDVETGFNINNGAFFADTTAMFYRQSWVGLKHDTYGSLTFGRQYQPSFWAVYSPIRSAATKSCRRWQRPTSPAHRPVHARDAVRVRPNQQFDRLHVAGS